MLYYSALQYFGRIIATFVHLTIIVLNLAEYRLILSGDVPRDFELSTKRIAQLEKMWLGSNL